MKKVIAIVICLVLELSMAGCGKTAMEKDEIYYCEHCNNEASDVKEAGSGYYCYDCIINEEYEKCIACGLYYENDGSGCNDVYCQDCFDDKGEICFLCWQSFGEMVSLEIDGEHYSICPDCATDYFTNIEPMIPVDYCVECGHLYPIGDYYYEHYIFCGASICQECLIKCGYEKCDRCGRYTDKGLTDVICGYCIEKENDNDNPL